MDGLYKTPVDAVTHNQQTVQWEVLTDSGRTVQDNSRCRDTEPTEGAVWGTDRHWTDYRRHQFKKSHRTNRRYSVRYWQTSDRLYQTPVDAVTQNQQTVQCEVLADIRQTVQDTSGCSDTEPTDGTLWGTYRQRTDYTRHQWTQSHGTNWR